LLIGFEYCGILWWKIVDDQDLAYRLYCTSSETAMPNTLIVSSNGVLFCILATHQGTIGSLVSVGIDFGLYSSIPAGNARLATNKKTIMIKLNNKIIFQAIKNSYLIQ
jgi:hypothetical protein